MGKLKIIIINCHCGWAQSTADCDGGITEGGTAKQQSNYIESEREREREQYLPARERCRAIHSLRSQSQMLGLIVIAGGGWRWG